MYVMHVMVRVRDTHKSAVLQACRSKTMSNVLPVTVTKQAGRCGRQAEPVTYVTESIVKLPAKWPRRYVCNVSRYEYAGTGSRWQAEGLSVREGCCTEREGEEKERERKRRRRNG